MTRHIGQKRLNVISFRLTDTEAAKTDALALKHGRTRNDVARAVLLHVTKQQVPSPVKQQRHPARKQPTPEQQELAKISAKLDKLGHSIEELLQRPASDTPERAVLMMIDDKVQDVSRCVANALLRRVA